MRVARLVLVNATMVLLIRRWNKNIGKILRQKYSFVHDNIKIG